MTEPRYTRLLARVLARKEEGEAVPAPLSKRMEEIALIRRTMRRRVGRRRTRVAALGGGAVVLALALAQLPRMALRNRLTDAHPIVAAPLRVVASSSAEGTVVTLAGSPVPLDADMPLSPGSRLRVGHGAGASLALSTGTRIAIDPDSEVSFRDRGRTAIFGLGSGSLKPDVAKLVDSDRFIVQTADSEVEVRGTSFRVSVVSADPECGEGTTTRVRVYEGVVAVRSNGREQFVPRGQDWPSGCAAPPAREADTAPAANARAEATHAARPARPDVSNLAEQNDQFAEAMLAKRSGATKAIAAFDRFLAKYPSCHLAENAAAERMKLLAEVDEARAVPAAKQYLAKYPAGFAREDAKSIASRHPDLTSP